MANRISLFDRDMYSNRQAEHLLDILQKPEDDRQLHRNNDETFEIHGVFTVEELKAVYLLSNMSQRPQNSPWTPTPQKARA